MPEKSQGSEDEDLKKKMVNALQKQYENTKKKHEKKGEREENAQDNTEDPSVYFPGVEDVVKDVIHNETIKTIREVDTDRESMYLYQKPRYGLNRLLLNPRTAGTYVRGEPFLKNIAEKSFLRLLREMSDHIDELGKDPDDPDGPNEKLGELKKKIDRKLKHDGIRNNEVNEVLQSLRRKTFVDAKEMNPSGYIPLKHGLLNLNTWEQEDFKSDRFFTWKVQGNYDPEMRSLNQVPVFKRFLLDAYRPESIPAILDYLGYTLHPAFPRQKIMVILGPPRMGKGTLSGIIERAIPEGFGRISLMKLLIPENKFSLQAIEGKNLLVDREIKRSFKRSADFDIINSLFGGDPLPLEKKFKAEVTYVSRSKGILIGNLPVFFVDNMAFLSRLLIVLTKSDREGPEIPDLADRIWNAEGEKIVAILLNRLRSLMSRDYRFSNEKNLNETAELWEKLADSVQGFAEERTEFTPAQYLPVDDAYDYYVKYCEEKGIPPVKKQQFTFQFSKHYKKKRRKEKGELYYAFEDCAVVTKVEMNKKSEPKSYVQRSSSKNDDDDLDEILG